MAEFDFLKKQNSMVGNLIRQWRKEKGFTQEQLANAIGVSTMSIRRYENGDRILPEETFKEIAKALGHSGEGKTFVDLALLDIKKSSADYIESLLAELEAQKDDPKDIDLLAAYRKLNKDGQKIAIERVEELTLIKKYQRTEPPEAPEADKEGEYTTKEEKPPEGL